MQHGRASVVSDGDALEHDVTAHPAQRPRPRGVPQLRDGVEHLGHPLPGRSLHGYVGTATGDTDRHECVQCVERAVHAVDSPDRWYRRVVTR